MKSRKARTKRIWLFAVISFWLAVGLSVPLFLDVSGDDVQFDNLGVVAAPRDSYEITSPLLLDRLTGTVLSGGRVALAVARDKPLTAADAAVRISGGNAVLILDRGEITIAGGPPPGTFVDGPQPAPLAEALAGGRYKALGMRDGAVVVRLPNGRRERLTSVSMRLVPVGKGRVEAKGIGYWRGQRTAFTLATGVTTAAGDVPVKLSFKATLIDFDFEGTMKLGADSMLAGPVLVHLKDTDRLASSMGTIWPIGTSVQDVLINGQMLWQGGVLAFDKAKIKAGENDATGTVTLNTATDTAGQALISSTLAFDRLDISPYLPGGTTKKSFLIWQWWNKLVATLSQPASPHINADIRLSAKSLSAGAYVLGPAAASIVMKNGRLSADVAEMTLAEGRATGQLAVDFNRYVPRITLRGQVEDFVTGQIAERVAGRRRIEGRARVIADLTSQGTDAQQIIGDLAGRIELEMAGEGSIGLSLARLVEPRDKNPALTAEQVLLHSLEGTTSITSLDAVWQLENGVATLTGASAAHAAGEVKASGRFDLNTWLYDLRLLAISGRPEASRKTEKPGKTERAPAASAEKNQMPVRSATLALIRSQQPQPPSEAARANVELYSLTGETAELERYLSPKPPGFRRGL